MSYGLLKRILAHVKIQGWLKEGDVIVDPFGGIGSTGILGAYEGYQVVCCELEQKFVDLAEQNFELHKDAWVEFGNPFPIILQGDSRRLCEVVEKATVIISSPPYSESLNAEKSGIDWSKLKEGGKKKTMSREKYGCNYGQTPGNLGAMKPGKVDVILSSPPYAETLKGDGTQKETAADSHAKRTDPKAGGPLGQSQRTQGYGSKGNLGNLKAGKVDMVVSSPPYAESLSSEKDGIDWSKTHREDGSIRDRTKEGAYKKRGTGYEQLQHSKSKDNLGNLKSGDVDCVISSPPHEGTFNYSKNAGRAENVKRREMKMKYGGLTAYSPNEKQIGNYVGDTFWQAAKTIVEQCHQILKPGGHAIWVVKSFVRKGKIVDFPGDWQRLCESVGFKTVCIHHAMLVKETSHKTLFGHTETKRKERKSFFRRLAESKGSPRIDYEVVLCMERSGVSHG